MSSVADTYDVIVSGGGISGTMAAIASARKGCRTLLIERYSALGGMSTLGLVQPITTWGINNRYVLGGTGKKILEQMIERNARSATPMSLYGPTCDSEYLKMELERQAINSGVELFYHAWVREAAVKDDGCIDYLVLLTKEGDIKVKGSIYIDATGDGDICAFAGVPFESSAKTYGQQGITLMMIVSGIDRSRCIDLEGMNKIWEEHAVSKRKVCFFWHPREGSAYFNMTEVAGFDGLKVEDLTKATIECRKQAWGIIESFREYMPGFENAYIEQTAPALGIRETRRIIGKYVLTGNDVKEGRNFEDTIARASCPVDVHFRNDGNAVYYGLKKSYAIPYRCLITDIIPNLIVTGRCISADQIANSSLRRMAPGFALGEAAGTAAFLALKTGDVRTVNVRELQEILEEYGAVLKPEE